MALDINHSLILNLLGIHLLALMSPGPDFVLVSKNALIHSCKSGIFTALGISLGLFIHITYTLTGLAFALKHTPLIFKFIQILGALYLIYLAINSLHSLFKKAKSSQAIDLQKIQYNYSALKFIKMGFFTNLLNPKVALFFISIFTQFIQKEVSELTKFSLALSLILTTFFYFSLVSHLITLSKIKLIYLKYDSYIEFIFSLILLLLAGKIIIITLF